MTLGTLVLYQLGRDRGDYRYAGRISLLVGAIRRGWARARRREAPDATADVDRRVTLADLAIAGARLSCLLGARRTPRVQIGLGAFTGVASLALGLLVLTGCSGIVPPLIGDPTSAAERGAEPDGWRFPEDARDALYDVVRARRDVRRFRPDPVRDEVLQRVLGAAHAAPSVGHSQPWRFLLVRDPELRDRAAVLTDRERLRQAALLEEGAARRREAPDATADVDRRGAFTIGLLHGTGAETPTQVVLFASAGASGRP